MNGEEVNLHLKFFNFALSSPISGKRSTNAFTILSEW